MATYFRSDGGSFVTGIYAGADSGNSGIDDSSFGGIGYVTREGLHPDGRGERKTFRDEREESNHVPVLPHWRNASKLLPIRRRVKPK